MGRSGRAHEADLPAYAAALLRAIATVMGSRRTRSTGFSKIARDLFGSRPRTGSTSLWMAPPVATTRVKVSLATTWDRFFRTAAESCGLVPSTAGSARATGDFLLRCPVFPKDK